MLNRDYDTYTLTLHDTLLEYPTLLDGFVLDTDEHTETFLRVFKARWDIYEIAGETIALEKRYLENRFNVVKDYYIELINAYETKINMLDGKKMSVITDRTEKVDDTTNSSSTDTLNTSVSNATTGETSLNNTGTSDDKHIDLPNKVVTTSETSKYLSSEDIGNTTDISTQNTTGSSNTISENTDNVSATGTRESNKDVDMTITTTGGVNVIELKKGYLDLLRNVYEDFANDFKRCFLYIYGVM